MHGFHPQGYSSLRFRPIRHLSSPVEDLEMCKVVGVTDKVRQTFLYSNTSYGQFGALTLPVVNNENVNDEQHSFHKTISQ